MVFCSNCGANAGAQAKFCSKCGTAVRGRKDEEPEPEQPEQDMFSSGATGYGLPAAAASGGKIKPISGLARHHTQALGSLFNYQAKHTYKKPGAKPGPSHVKHKTATQQVADIAVLMKVVMLPVSHPREELPGDITDWPHEYVNFYPGVSPVLSIKKEPKFRNMSDAGQLVDPKEWSFGKSYGKGAKAGMDTLEAPKLAAFANFKRFYKDKKDVYCLALIEDPEEPEVTAENLPDLTFHPPGSDSESSLIDLDKEGEDVEDNDEEESETWSTPRQRNRPAFQEFRQQSTPSKTAGTAEGSRPSSSRAGARGSVQQKVKRTDKSGPADKEKRHKRAESTFSETAVDDLLKTLDGFVGLTSLKGHLEHFAKSVFMKRKCGREKGRQGLHMVFVGNPGTGKTSVATALTGFLCSLGIINKPQPSIVQRGDLVSKWIGQTTEVTRKKIQESKGGVLLVDEAYRLAQADSSSRDVGKEALEELMSVMEGGDPIMIFAGYPGEMASFLDVNPGMKSRIAYKFHFPDYSVEELAQIMRNEVAGMGLSLSPEANRALEETISETTTEEQRSVMNGRLARQVIEGAENHMFSRCYPNDVEGCKTINQRDLEESFRTFLSGR
ncbi:uncharacterized protein LOC144907510 [Branchiostoma floridae x Branchiostoma belcheri]